MLFNSLTYVAFVLVVFLVYHLAPRARFQLMLVASAVFYCSWSPLYALLFYGVVAASYPISLRIRATRGTRAASWWVAAGVVLNLGVLGGFKYANFVLDNALVAASWLGWAGGGEDWAIRLILPLAISFYTFQLIALLVDIHRGNAEPLRSLWEHALFISFFPQLIAGPIVRYPQLVEQIRHWREPELEELRKAFVLLAIGAIKKVVIADNLAPFANDVFAEPGAYNSLFNLAAVYAFAVQIYCDFSGYCDLALGSALLFGIRLPENFAKPYESVSITEFWRRWHMSLSFWLRDYLYIPLGGNRHGRARTYRNLLLTMSLGGLWHGASWTFLVWGAYHGALLSVERALGWGQHRAEIASSAVRRLRALLTFHLVCVGWVFFRASDIGSAFDVLGRVAALDLALDLRGLVLLDLIDCGWVALGLAAIVALRRERILSAYDRLPWGLRPVVLAALAIVLTLLAPSGAKEFIYFQF